MIIIQSNISVGFLVFRPGRQILLHLRGPENDPDPDLWAAIGGHEEPEDRGDLRKTLRRELQEELEFTIPVDAIHEIAQQVDGQGRTIAVHIVPVPSTNQTFTIHEGRGVGWFSISEALNLPNLADVTRADLSSIARWFDTADAETACSSKDAS